MKILENRTFSQLEVGDEAQLTRLCTVDDLYAFASASGDHNPLHLAAYDGDGDGRPEAVAPALWPAGLVAAVLGNILPGAGTQTRRADLAFHVPVLAGDELTAFVTVAEKLEDGDLICTTEVHRVGDNILVLSGSVQVTPPAQHMEFDSVEVPGLVVQRHRHFDALLEKARPLDPMPTAVVAPEDANSLGGALLGYANDIITPILVGNRGKVEAAAAELGADLTGIEIVEAASHGVAAHKAVDLVVEGKAETLMKGYLHTDELLHAVLRREKGLRTGRRLSHVFVMDVPGMSRPIMVTDAAVNIAPDLETKADIVQNAIHLAHSIGIETPKVGVLSAVETINPHMPSSVDAALLSKMAERGQITGGLVDGPLAMDNAVDLNAARTKGITSEVGGAADILVAPNIEAGNMVAKQLTFISHAEAAGIVLGAAAPIILTSRSDDDASRLASCAVAALHANATKGKIHG
ncbi:MULTISPECIES: bifunctional enoyl-CoA hydratase/phosphate acetyltransferase [unclassified Ruegeria]|uniref:bifunctional enoyl-CoA hydratase/phosphate acetyltransferase n=1 Tax=unclassified Ruegeria TaxID=2625375 RepID=UPI001AD9D1FD|nr:MULTISPECIES: bifunctional enoyl-CoA hydratase/phosphate acetyltransferase [unclassified Ruegeria]MBO9412521.1 bifunctional enoyl-CoA hydratase/phosphate acetyltransferase [Ruegeria sp. R8_1]MBO9416241.1 bifunctional enoyl-CoA hydratase/phosphate acetyltransferase [Ruegeria sp. R8_2]